MRGLKKVCTRVGGHERNYGLDSLLWAPVFLGTRSSHCIFLGMDAQVTVFSWNTSGILNWGMDAQSPYSLGIRTELQIGHGCFNHPNLSWNTNGMQSHGKVTALVCLVLQISVRQNIADTFRITASSSSSEQ